MDTETIQQYNTTQNQAGMMTRPIIDAGILKLRLDTTDTLEQVELFLRGCRMVYHQDEKTGKISPQRLQVGLAKANDNGVQSILNWLTCTLNPHAVQGNFPMDKSGNSPKYDNYIEEYHIELAKLLVNNCYNWDIDDDEIDGIIDFIVLQQITFSSRLIDNKERESYSESLKMGESTTVQNKQRGFSIFGG